MSFIFSGFVVVFYIFLGSTPTVTSASETGRYSLPKGVNGGVGCLVCTTVVAVTEQLSVVHNETFVEAYARLCDVLPNLYRNACIALGNFYIPQIIDLITEEVDPDVICHSIYLCYEDKGQPYCRAFPPKGDFREKVSRSRKECLRNYSTKTKILLTRKARQLLIHVLLQVSEISVNFFTGFLPTTYHFSTWITILTAHLLNHGEDHPGGVGIVMMLMLRIIQAPSQ